MLFHNDHKGHRAGTVETELGNSGPGFESCSSLTSYVV